MNSDLDNFESELKKCFKKGLINISFSDDFIEHLYDNAEPIKPSEKLTSEIKDIISNAKIDRLKEEEEEINGSTTFGEYITNLEAKISSLFGINQIKEYLLMTLSDDTIKRIKNDQLDKVSISEVADCIKSMLIPFKAALLLLERSFRIMDLKKKGLVFSSNARINEQPNTAGRYKTTMSAMHKLLLSIDKENKLTDVEKEWSDYKRKLEFELKRSSYI